MIFVYTTPFAEHKLFQAATVLTNHGRLPVAWEGWPEYWTGSAPYGVTYATFGPPPETPPPALYRAEGVLLLMPPRRAALDAATAAFRARHRVDPSPYAVANDVDDATAAMTSLYAALTARVPNARVWTARYSEPSLALKFLNTKATIPCQ